MAKLLMTRFDENGLQLRPQEKSPLEGITSERGLSQGNTCDAHAVTFSDLDCQRSFVHPTHEQTGVGASFSGNRLGCMLDFQSHTNEIYRRFRKLFRLSRTRCE
jgi:hypothetical protein